MSAIGLRARNSNHFRWTVGMRDLDGRVVLAEADEQGRVLWGDPSGYTAYWAESANAVPDMAHAGTQGEVLGLVRESCGDESIIAGKVKHHATPSTPDCWLILLPNHLNITAPTEAEVIVSALEAA